MNSLQPAFSSAIFNTNAFNSGQFLTKSEADRYYLSIYSGRNLNLIDGITAGIVSSSKAVIVDSSNNITGFGNIGSSGVLTMSNTNDSILINNTSSSGRSNIKFQNDLGAWEIGLRGSTTGSYPNCLYYYNGGYRLILNSSGDVQILSTTASSSTTTGSLIVSGGIGLAGNLNVGGSSFFQALTTNSTTTFNGTTTFNNNVYTNNNITFNNYTNGISNVNYINLAYSYSINGIIACNSNYNIYLQSPSFSGVYGYMSLNNNGVFINRSNYNPTGTCNSNCLIDFGTESHSCQINLYNGQYFITAADNCTQIMSGGSNGVTFGVGSGYTASIYNARLTPQGSFEVSNGLRACGYDTTNYSSWSGPGAEIHYAASTASFFGYNRNTLLYTACQFGQNMFCSSTGQWGIGTTVDNNYLLRLGYQMLTYSGGYGYINSSASTGTGTNTGNVAFSMYTMGRILVTQEVDIMSDIRLKSNIKDVYFEEAEAFVKWCLPKHYIKNNESEYGYISQDILKASYLGTNTNNLKNLISIVPNEELEEYIDEDGFKSEAGLQFNISYSKIVTLLHRYILELEKRIEVLEMN